MRPRALGSAIIVVALALSSVVVRADDAAESRFFDGIARDAYAHRHYAEALEAFLRAHRAAPSARLLYNIALCAELAHREPMAFAYFDELLTRSDERDAEIRTDATTRRDRLAHQLALVHVESDPPGAEIFVDQRDHGSFGRTPRTLALPAGAHHIELTLADHADASADVTAATGEARATHVALEPYRGAVTVALPVAGATIVARSSAEDISIAPGTRTELPVGTYTLLARAPGYRSETLDLRVARDADEHRAMTIEPLPVPTGRLLVTTGDVHARVRVDGTDRAETPARVDSLTVGSHEVAIAADGYLDWTGSIDVAEDRTAFVSVTLTRAR